METHRPDGLISDPYAEAFLQRAETKLPMSQPSEEDPELAEMWSHMAAYTGIRTKFFDDFFIAAARDGIEQAVILASGLDTRPYRIDVPPDTYELDQPGVLEFKDRVLDEQQATPRNRRTAIAVDLRHDWPGALTEAGFSPDRSTAWLAEGLLPYLPADARDELLNRIDELSAPGSRVTVEYFAHDLESFQHHPLVQRSSQRLGISMSELFYAEEGNDPRELLNARGWTVDTVTADEQAEIYRRPLHEEVRPMFAPVQFVTAGKNG
jgi:methyltransferase (TIGR00027 family)